MRRALVMAALAAGLATPALAVDQAAIEARYTPAFRQCLDSPEGQSTMGMVQCMGAELEIQDATLNTAWRNLVADMTPDQKAGLQKPSAPGSPSATPTAGPVTARTGARSPPLRPTCACCKGRSSAPSNWRPSTPTGALRPKTTTILPASG